jgi:type II secretory pathway pseudopilin PulG
MDDMTRRIGQQGRRDERGFTYIALLVFVAIMGVGLAATGEVWHMTVKREKEVELLFAGNQIRNAIDMYNQQPGQVGRYPMSLEDLVKDPRFPNTKRYLRKIYLDPVTNSANWALVKGANGEIVGVHSTSDDEPAKKANFNFADIAFEGKTKYSEWVFTASIRHVSAPTLKKPSGALGQSMNP